MMAVSSQSEGLKLIDNELAKVIQIITIKN